MPRKRKVKEVVLEEEDLNIYRYDDGILPWRDEDEEEALRLQDDNESTAESVSTEGNRSGGALGK